MSMTHIPPTSDRHHPNWNPLADVQGASEIGNRFSESFTAFLQEKKQTAVVELLREEFPQLADDQNFVQKVVDALDDSEIIEEKPYVFLSLNPRLSQRK